MGRTIPFSAPARRSPPPGHSCRSRVGGLSVSAQGVGPLNPTKDNGVPTPRIHNNLFSVPINTPPGVPKPTRPSAGCSAIPLAPHGIRDDSAAVEAVTGPRGALTPLINLPAAATCAGESRCGTGT